MRRFTALTVLLLLAGPARASGQSEKEQMILDALRNGHGSRKQAAEILGISPRTLRYKLQKLREAGISVPR